MKRRYLEDERLSLILFLVIWLLYTVIYMTKNCYSAAMADLVNEQVLTKSQTGAINAAFYLIYAVFQVIGGFAVDKFSPGRLVFVGFLGAAICNAVIYFNQNYTVMMVTWSINAIVQFGVWPGVFKIVSAELAKVHRKKAIFYISLANSAGLILSYFCAALVNRWQSNFSISAISMFLASFIWYFVYRYAEKRMVTETIEKPVEKVEKVKKQENKGNFIMLMISTGAVLIMASNFIQSILNSGLKALTPVMIMESYDAISPALANSLNILLIAGGVIASFVARKFVFKRVKNEASVMTLFFILSMPLVVLFALVGRIPAMVLFLDLTLVVAFMTVASLTVFYVSARFAKYGCDGTASGVFNAMAALGIVAANFVFTKLADSFGWTVTNYVFIGTAVVGLIVTAAAIPLWRKMLKD